MKTALVTGANKGIGFEIAKLLGQKGFHIFVTGRNEEKLMKAIQLLNTFGVSVRYVTMDVTSKTSIAFAFEKIVKECDAIDVLINNAGIMEDHGIELFDIDSNTMDDTLDTNALGPFYVTKYFLPLLKPGSRVINISSEGGRITGGINTWAHAYCISKTILNIFTMHMAYALKAKGVSVNAMCPGWTKTDMGGEEATRTIEKGAETALWLATEKINQTGMFFKDKKIIPW